MLVHYRAEWCGPCKMVMPSLEEAASNFGFDLTVGYLDIDENHYTPPRFGIRAIPTLMLFNKGKVAAQKVGAMSYSQMSKFIEDNIYQEGDVDDAARASQHEYLGIALIEDKLRVVGLTPDGQFQVKDSINKYSHLIHTYSLENLSLQRAIEEFEELMNDKRAKEQDFQEFFERNDEFILNDEYRCAHSKIVLEREDEGPLIPDFVMQPIDQSGLCDILELKTPHVNVFVLKKNRLRFSAAVMEAAAQLREYSIYFDEQRNREKVYAKYSVEAYKPRMIVVLGRSGTLSPVEIRKAESDLGNIKLKTYDEILAQAKFRLSKRGFKT